MLGWKHRSVRRTAVTAAVVTAVVGVAAILTIGFWPVFGGPQSAEAQPGPWDGEQAEAAGYPGPSTTGAPEDCDHLPLDERDDLDEEGEVIDGVRFDQGVTVWASDRTIRNSCIFAHNSYSGIRVMTDHHELPDAENLLVEDVTIVGMDDQCQQGIGFSNYTARRVATSGCYDGFRIGSHTTIEDSYVDDLNQIPGETHNDAIQSTGDENRDTENIRIHNNTLFSVWQGHQVILLQAKFGHIDDVEISGNLLQGGGYTFYIEGVEGMTGPTNVVVEDNLFVADSWQYGPWLIRTTEEDLPEPDVTMSGNRATDGTNLDDPDADAESDS